MNPIHDVIKILYTRSGYLPNYPYHLISDDEMCDAFIRLPEDVYKNLPEDFFGITLDQTSTGIDWYNMFLNDVSPMYFKVNYPLIDEEITKYYEDLVNRIFYEIQQFKNSLDSDRVLPDWVYSYMLGVCIGPESDKLDIHSMISSKAMGTDNIYDDYNLECAIRCLVISKEWLYRLIVPKGDVQRPPTMFGEPHVLKAIRLFDESLALVDSSSR